MTTTATHQDGRVLVIGGSGGLGSAIVRRLAPDWQALDLTYRRNKDVATTLCAELDGDVSTHQVDLLDRTSIASLFDTLAGQEVALKSIVFAPGVHIAQPYISTITTEQWAEVIQVELMGFLSVVEHALPILRASGGGSIVNIGTVATTWYPPGDGLSAVPKAGTEMLCRAIAKEEGRFGIRANTVAPGLIDAGLGSDLMATLFNDEIWQQQKKRTPLQRFGRGQDIADAVAFLCSDQSGFITGQTLVVDGGLSL